VEAEETWAPPWGRTTDEVSDLTQLAAHSGNLVTISPLPDEIDISYMRNAGTVRHGPSFGKRTVRKKNDGTTSDDMQKLPKVP